MLEAAESLPRRFKSPGKGTTMGFVAYAQMEIKSKSPRPPSTGDDASSDEEYTITGILGDFSNSYGLVRSQTQTTPL